MEKKKYITFNQRIIDRLAEFGFKRKNKEIFVKKPNDDIIQSIIFGHSTNGYAHMKFYGIRNNIAFPKVLLFAKQNNLYMPLSDFFNENIGYLMPKSPSYMEWSIGEDTDEEYDNKVIDDMLYHVKKLSLPFFDKYSTPAAIVDGIKKRGFHGQYGDDYHACAILLLYGKKEDFLWFVEQRSYEKQFHVYEPGQHWDFRHPKEPLNRTCKEFLEFAEKLSSIFGL